MGASSGASASSTSPWVPTARPSLAACAGAALTLASHQPLPSLASELYSLVRNVKIFFCLTFEFCLTSAKTYIATGTAPALDVSCTCAHFIVCLSAYVLCVHSCVHAILRYLVFGFAPSSAIAAVSMRAGLCYCIYREGGALTWPARNSLRQSLLEVFTASSFASK